MVAKDSLATLAMAAFSAFAMSCAGDAAGKRDDDLDGFTEKDGDCNDHNDGVYPGAREQSYDELDADCDGEDMPAGGEDRYADALPLLDTDGDDAISLEEFDAACAESAMLFGNANPGVLETHSSCSGTSSCRGMILHPWNELYEHDCGGVNGCQGWSCVETAAGEDRDGPTAFTAAHCDYCHTGSDGAFLVVIPEGEDPAAYVDGFFDRSDTEFRSAIAFGLRGIDANGVAWSNMPAHYAVLSRAEMDSVIAYVRTLDLEAPSEEEE